MGLQSSQKLTVLNNVYSIATQSTEDVVELEEDLESADAVRITSSHQASVEFNDGEFTLTLGANGKIDLDKQTVTKLSITNLDEAEAAIVRVTLRKVES